MIDFTKYSKKSLRNLISKNNEYKRLISTCEYFNIIIDFLKKKEILYTDNQIEYLKEKDFD
jgi:hypothetical protein